MITSGQIVAFGAASVVLIAVPGPSVLFIVGQALAAGRRAALASVAGNALGAYTVAVLAAFGFGPVLQRFPVALIILKFAGAAFLCWLGITAISNRKKTAPTDDTTDLPPGRDWATLRRGFVIGVTNPKAYVMFAVILPHFLRPDARPLVLQILALAVIPVLIGLLSDAAWAAFSGAARKWFARSAARLHALGLTGGILMIGLGVLMAAT